MGTILLLSWSIGLHPLDIRFMDSALDSPAPRQVATMLISSPDHEIDLS